MGLTNQVSTKQWQESIVSHLQAQDAPVILSPQSPGQYRTEPKDGLVDVKDACGVIRCLFGLGETSAEWANQFVTSITSWLDGLDSKTDDKISISVVKSKAPDALRDSLVTFLQSSLTAANLPTDYPTSVGNYITALQGLKSSHVTKK